VKRSIWKSFSILAGLTVFEKIIAFVFQAVIAASFGAGAMTDAYFSATEFYGVLEYTLLSSLTVAVLNKYANHVNNGSDVQGFDFLSECLSFFLPIIAALSLLIYLFSKQISYVIAPGFDDATRVLLIRCLHIMAVIPIIECVTAIGQAVLRQKKLFAIVNLKSLFISVIGISAILLFGKNSSASELALSFGYVASFFLFCALSVYFVNKYGKLRVTKPKFSKELKETISMFLPLIVSYGISRVALMIDKTIASLLEPGSVSALTYAHGLYKIVEAVFITNLSLILLTDFNELILKRDYCAVNEKIKSVTSIMSMLLIPITAVTMVCSSDITEIVYSHGKFSSSSAENVAGVLMIYAINFVPAMIYGVYNQVMYANGDSKNPMWIAAASIFVNVSVSFLLLQRVGLAGVAYGTLFASVIAIFMCRRTLKKDITIFDGCFTKKFIINCAIGFVICMFTVYVSERLFTSALLSFITCTFTGTFSFFSTLLILKDENLMIVVSTLKRKFSKEFI